MLKRSIAAATAYTLGKSVLESARINPEKLYNYTLEDPFWKRQLDRMAGPIDCVNDVIGKVLDDEAETNFTAAAQGVVECFVGQEAAHISSEAAADAETAMKDKEEL